MTESYNYSTEIFGKNIQRKYSGEIFGENKSIKYLHPLMLNFYFCIYFVLDRNKMKTKPRGPKGKLIVKVLLQRKLRNNST